MVKHCAVVHDHDALTAMPAMALADEMDGGSDNERCDDGEGAGGDHGDTTNAAMDDAMSNTGRGGGGAVADGLASQQQPQQHQQPQQQQQQQPQPPPPSPQQQQQQRPNQSPSPSGPSQQVPQVGPVAKALARGVLVATSR